MDNRWKKYTVLSVALLLVIALTGFVNVGVVAAQEEEPVEFEIKGTVVGVDEDAGTFDVEDEDGVVFTIVPGDDFDWEAVFVGAYVEVEGTEGDDGNLNADKVEVEDNEGDEDDVDDDEDIDGEEEDAEEGDEEDDEFGTTRGFYCATEGSTHPFAARLAETYETDYAQIMTWFCEGGLGFGEIMLALQSGVATGTEPQGFVEQRKLGFGWGQIWKQGDLVDTEDDWLPPGQAKKQNDEQDGNAAPGNSGNAPGQNKDNEDSGSPGNSGNAPGQNKDNEDNGSPGNSGNHGNNGNNGNNGNGNGNGRGNDQDD